MKSSRAVSEDQYLEYGSRMRRERDALQRRVTELEAALKKYGDHTKGGLHGRCDYWIADTESGIVHNHGVHPCTCGFDAALKGSDT